mmetsp:Transcript_4300/g.11450  ORF Transcript_4300/g.11450 Transcript_4300/m.11450 type:complete len:299 (-) Transcript_4300:73-969(-)
MDLAVFLCCVADDHPRGIQQCQGILQVLAGVPAQRKLARPEGPRVPEEHGVLGAELRLPPAHEQRAHALVQARHGPGARLVGPGGLARRVPLLRDQCRLLDREGAGDAREDPGVDVHHGLCEAMLRPQQRRDLSTLPEPGAQPTVGAEGRLAGAGASELGGVLARHVADVALHVHELVVPQKQHHLAPMLRRLVLKVEQHLVDAAGMVAAVDDVTGLHQDRLATGPVPFLVHDAQCAQELRRMARITMQVAHREDAACLAARGQGRGLRGGTSQRLSSPADAEDEPDAHCQEGSGSGR